MKTERTVQLYNPRLSLPFERRRGLSVPGLGPWWPVSWIAGPADEGPGQLDYQTLVAARVREIRRGLERNWTVSRIAQWVRVSPQTVAQDIGAMQHEPWFAELDWRALSMARLAEIKRRAARGESAADIAYWLHIPPSHVAAERRVIEFLDGAYAKRVRREIRQFQDDGRFGISAAIEDQLDLMAAIIKHRQTDESAAALGRRMPELAAFARPNLTAIVRKVEQWERGELTPERVRAEAMREVTKLELRGRAKGAAA